MAKPPRIVAGKESDMSALDTQPGGDHYRNKAIQPVEYIHANGLGFLEGCIVKRITRWKEKDGIKDLEKIKHECDLLIELEARKAKKPELPMAWSGLGK
jgi:hypothetical protein